MKELTSPVNAVGIAAKHSMAEERTRAPYMSHRGPSTMRTIVVPAEPTIADVQMSVLLIPRVIRISGVESILPFCGLFGVHIVG